MLELLLTDVYWDVDTACCLLLCWEYGLLLV